MPMYREVEMACRRSTTDRACAPGIYIGGGHQVKRFVINILIQASIHIKELAPGTYTYQGVRSQKPINISAEFFKRFRKLHIDLTNTYVIRRPFLVVLTCLYFTSWCTPNQQSLHKSFDSLLNITSTNLSNSRVCRWKLIIDHRMQSLAVLLHFPQLSTRQHTNSMNGHLFPGNGLSIRCCFVSSEIPFFLLIFFLVGSKSGVVCVAYGCSVANIFAYVGGWIWT